MSEATRLWKLLAQWEALLEHAYSADRLAAGGSSSPRGARSAVAGAVAGDVAAAASLVTAESGLGGLSPASAVVMRPPVPVINLPSADDAFPFD